jgi:4-hydroxy-tetrahydrodipicolinate synthase
LTEKEKLDEEAFEHLVDFCIEGGVSGIFTMGTSGEAMEVTDKVWLDTVKAGIKYASDRVPVFCGVIDSCTSRVIQRIRLAEDAGARNVVVTPPFYLSVCSQDEIIRHFEKICSATKLNIVAYNIPDTTKANILPETIKRIAEMDNVVMYKDSAADWQQFQRNLFLLEDSKISVFNGAEEFCTAAVICGADGCVPGLANFFPRLFVDLYEAGAAGDIQKACGLQKKVYQLRQMLFIGKSWMSTMKYLSKVFGFGTGKVSYPIEPLTPSEELRIHAMLDAYAELMESTVS